MKTLYESIIDDDEKVVNDTFTNTDMYLVKSWCEKNLFGVIDENYSLDRNLRIICCPRKNIIVNCEEKIPKYIKFGYIKHGLFISSEALFSMTQDQLPEMVGSLYIRGKIVSNHAFTIKVIDNLAFQDQPSNLQLNSLKIIYGDNLNRKTFTLGTAFTRISTDNLRNITLEGTNDCKIEIRNTPAATEIRANLKKLNNEELQKYLNDIFKNMPNVRIVTLSARIKLFRDITTGVWTVSY